MRKLFIMSFCSFFIGSLAFGESTELSKTKTPASKANKKEIIWKRHLEKLKKTFPEDMAEVEQLKAAGKNSEASLVMQNVYRKRDIMELDKLAKKYPEEVANIKKLMQDDSIKGKKAYNNARMMLRKRFIADRKRKLNIKNAKISQKNFKDE